MKSMKVRVVLSALALLAIASAALVAQAPAPPPKRVALLVGINEYNRRGFVDLKWAENDVDAVGQELRRIGFDQVVTLKGTSAGALKATRENIDKQLMGLLSGVGKNDVVLVMLSGHGQELPVKRADGTTVRDQFYCPIDAVVNKAETMFSLSRLTDETLHTWGGKNLVLVDACRDGVVDNDKGVARGIQGKVVALPEGTAVLFACASGQRSIELGRLEHGVFTHGVLEALKDFDGSKGPLTWDSLVNQVKNNVFELNPEQEPIAAGVLGRLVLANRVGGAPMTRKADVDRPRPSASNLPAQIGLTVGELRDDNGLKMKFRWCPPGKFRMGSPASEPERQDREGPVDVTLSQGFWLGQFEVTQSQWQTVMGTSLRDQMAKADSTSLYGEGPDHPIYYVNHTEATEFCTRLTETERRAGRLPSGWVYALPTEAQWEYAARGGLEGRRYPWGDDFDADALADTLTHKPL